MEGVCRSLSLTAPTGEGTFDLDRHATAVGSATPLARPSLQRHPGCISRCARLLSVHWG